MEGMPESHGRDSAGRFPGSGGSRRKAKDFVKNNFPKCSHPFVLSSSKHGRVTAFGWEFSVHPSTNSTTRVVYGQMNGKFIREVIYNHILIFKSFLSSPPSSGLFFSAAALIVLKKAFGTVRILACGISESFAKVLSSLLKITYIYPMKQIFTFS
jgi:hypothetical protein